MNLHMVALQKRKIKEHPKLGTVPDGVIAKQIECSNRMVMAVRDGLGIPSFKDWYKIELLRLRDVCAKSDLIGQYYDDDVAEFLEVKPCHVTAERHFRGLPKNDERMPSRWSEAFNNWKCIPARVGLSPNQWRRAIREAT